jgi:site-specific DNA-cytosine methylase
VDNLFNNELIMLKVLDLFSGIGGFSLGLESTGHFETIAFCRERTNFVKKFYKKILKTYQSKEK